MRHTATEINRILGTPDDAEIGIRYLDHYPITLYTPTPDTIQRFLKEHGNIAGDTEVNNHRAETLSHAVALAHAFDQDKPFIKERRKVTSPEKIVQLIMPALRDLKHEQLITIALDTKNSVIDQWTAPTTKLRRKDTVRLADIKGRETTFKGSLNESVIHPREIFRFAIEKSANSIIIAHNHPSGDPTPSYEDIQATKSIHQAGKIIRITLVDHIIIGAGSWVSMKAEGII